MADPRPLPVAWDGVPIEWGTWESDLPILICPPPRPEPCPGCGLATTKAAARGVRHPLRWHGPLIAYRCTNCGHDQVLDLGTGETWDLDITDYGPDGSWSVEQGARRG